MTFEPKNIQVYNKKCVGCINHKKDIMIAIDGYQNNLGTETVHDLFLNSEQAQKLINLLQIKLKENETIIK